MNKARFDKRSICLIDELGKVLQTFDSIKRAAQILFLNPQKAPGIVRVLKGFTTSYKGGRFKYAEK